MASLVDNARAFPTGVHRKPLPQTFPSQQPRTQEIVPDIQYRPSQQPQYSSHSHTRTASSAVIPEQQSYSHAPSNMNPVSYQAYMNQQPARRTLSNATTSTTSTGGGPPVRQNSGSSLQRTTSSRSGNSPQSYVALMRKQKATVWSDRAQHEDPRLLAQQRAAKQRAFMEVSGAGGGSRLSTSGSSSITGGVRSKIRHHGAPKALQYAPAANPGSGVPMRLSAREVDEDNSDEHSEGRHSMHQRSGSGRSSLGSLGPATGASLSMSQAAQTASNTTATQPDALGQSTTAPPGREHSASNASQTPVPEQYARSDYFEPRRQQGGEPISGSSGDSERENSFGAAKSLPVRQRGTAEEEAAKHDLARRGSVDERTMTMSGYGRLFVANPDVED